MSIIITQNGKNSQRIDTSNIEEEKYLQEFISDNPGVIPLEDIKEGTEILALAREFNTVSGPIDILATDKEGEIYIIETKLFKNPDKRKVLSQVMDYGAALWKGYSNTEDFINDINLNLSRTSKKNLESLTSEAFAFDQENALLVIDNIKENLEDGLIKFLILMDKIDDRLKNLILFMNQNSKFDIYAVELEIYKYKDLEITIPKLFGSDIKKDLNISKGVGRYWDEDSFFEALHEKIFDNEVVEIIKRIYNAVKKTCKEDIFYTTTKIGTFNFRCLIEGKLYSLFHVRTDGVIRFYYLNKFPNWRTVLYETGINLPLDKNEYEIMIYQFKDTGKLEKFLKIIPEINEKILYKHAD